MRILLFTGKGGVGKTTVAAATALRAARAGQRVLVMSTDPAHSLADAFDLEIGGDATPLQANLFGVQIDAQARLEEGWREIQDYVLSLLDWGGVDAVAAEELSVIPGLDEIFSLTDVKKAHDSGNYDLLVVDCAPTAETLRLLSLPDAMNWYIERIFPVERRVMKVVRPVLSRVTSMPIADDRIFAVISRIHQPLERVPERVLGLELYGNTDPTARMHDDEPMKITKKSGGYTLSLHLPFAGKSDLDLMRKGDDLYVRVGSYKRTFLLPSVLTRLEIGGATFEDDRLVISFRKDEQKPSGTRKEARGGT